MSTQYIPTDPALAHLGGYVIGGDEATYFPGLWSWLVGELQVVSVLDIGCGEGHALKYFRDKCDCNVKGIDGLPKSDPDIMVHDYTEGRLYLDEQFTLGWCCEFVEHIEERYMPNFLASFEACCYIAMTHATPGQAGHHHVNCQDREYWIGAMAATGFTYDGYTTQIARRVSEANKSPWNHFRRSGMIFKNAHQ